MKIKTIIIAILLVAVITGATALYNILGERLEPTEVPPTQAAVSVPTGQQTAEEESHTEAQEQKPTETQQAGAESSSPTDGQEARVKAFAFTVQDANGNNVSLSDMQGKPVVVNFWASWCGPCKNEMPGFENTYKELGEEIQFMMICIVDGNRETKETGADFIKDSEYTFPVYYDITLEAAIAYDVRSIPATYFVDKEGYLITRAEGGINEKTLQRGIDMIR